MLRYIWIALLAVASSGLLGQEGAAVLLEDNTERFAYYYLTADSLRKANSHELAIPMYKQAIKYSKKSEENNYPIYYKIGASFKNVAEYDSAVHYFTLALNSPKINPDFTIKAKSSLGMCYTNIGDYALAEHYLNESIDEALKLNDSINIASVKGYLASLYSGRDQFKKAIQVYREALTFISQAKKLSRAINLGNIGAMFIELQEYDSAKYYVNKSVEISREINDDIGIIIGLNNLATIYRDQQQYDKALPMYQQALKLIDTLGLKEEKKDILWNLADTYENLGQMEMALQHYKAFLDIKNEIISEEKARTIAEMQEKYEASERDRQIANLKVEKQQNEAEKLALKNTILIGLFVVITIGVIVRLRIVKQRNRHNIEVITATIDAQEKERERISQDIHDDLGGLLGMARMLFGKSKAILQKKDEELYQRIDDLLLNANQRSRSISHELYSPTLRTFGLEKATEELFNTIQQGHPDKNITFSANIGKAMIDRNLELNVYRIIQELMSNCLKHAEASEVKVSLKADKSSLQLSYKDNGKGFDIDKTKNGVGLLSIHSRVKRFQGKMNLDSKPGKGTRVTNYFEL